MDDSFVISIYCESWTPGAEEPERGVEIEREAVDVSRLESYARDYGINEASSSEPMPVVWFNSTSPMMDRDYIRNGVEKYYSLHIHEINGCKLTSEGYRKVADIIGVKLGA